MIIDSNLTMKPNIFPLIFLKKVSMHTFINKLISLFSRETVRSLALDMVFFHNFIFKHGYRCALFQFKRKVIPNLK